MASRRRQEGGKKQNAEGMHGDLTHEAIQNQLKHKVTTESADTPAGDEAEGGENSEKGSGKSSEKGSAKGSLKAHAPGPDGKHRLFEGRKQHDEADRNSERTRLAREIRGTAPGEK